jgi:hypothetical protein
MNVGINHQVQFKTYVDVFFKTNSGLGVESSRRETLDPRQDAPINISVRRKNRSFSPALGDVLVLQRLS